ncbi:YybH family protein [Saccharicrinis sp. FJH62]|uniref:YybH family protein n=1 Tax=Saccharicrinis sp. FJH62 TaxID=3344657 RepID=UPI0035D4CDC2
MEEEIRQLILQRVLAVKKREISKLSMYYTNDVILFDVVGNLKYTGIDALIKRLKEWLASLSEIKDFEISDIKIEAASDIACSSGLNHVDAITADKNKLDMYWRETTCYTKSDGVWKIMHTHSSVPFDPTTGKALAHLKPDLIVK